jgi:hypothetical protein
MENLGTDWLGQTPATGRCEHSGRILKLVVCILLRVLGHVQGFRLTQHWFEYFIQYVAVTEQNIQTSVALDGNPEPDTVGGC